MPTIEQRVTALERLVAGLRKADNRRDRELRTERDEVRRLKAEVAGMRPAQDPEVKR